MKALAKWLYKRTHRKEIKKVQEYIQPQPDQYTDERGRYERIGQVSGALFAMATLELEG